VELTPIRLSCYGYMNTISTYNTYLSTHQLSDYSESSIGWIFSVYIFLTFFCGIQIGPIFDARGPRLLVLSGSILMMASILLMGICSRMYSPRCLNLNLFLTGRRVLAIPCCLRHTRRSWHVSDRHACSRSYRPFLPGQAR